MQFKVVALLLPFCLVQAIHCSSITPEDRLKIIVAEEELILAIKTTAIEVNLVEIGVNNQINIAGNEIKRNLKELKTEVKVAVKEAESSGRDIQNCVDVLKVSSKSLEDSVEINLRNCRNIQELQQIELKLNELRSLKNVLWNGGDKCVVVEDVSKCIDGIIEDVEQNRNSLVSDIQNILPTVDVNVQLTCIASVNEKLNNDLGNIVNVWRNCINQK